MSEEHRPCTSSRLRCLLPLLPSFCFFSPVQKFFSSLPVDAVPCDASNITIREQRTAVIVRYVNTKKKRRTPERSGREEQSGASPPLELGFSRVKQLISRYFLSNALFIYFSLFSGFFPSRSCSLVGWNLEKKGNFGKKTRRMS